MINTNHVMVIGATVRRIDSVWCYWPAAVVAQSVVPRSSQSTSSLIDDERAGGSRALERWLC